MDLFQRPQPHVDQAEAALDPAQENSPTTPIEISLESEREALLEKLHNTWLLGKIETEILAPVRGLEIDGRQSRTSLVPYGVMKALYTQYVTKVSSQSSEHSQIVEYQGNHYLVSITPSEFLGLVIYHVKNLEKVDERASKLLDITNIAQIQKIINVVENFDIDLSESPLIDFKEQREIFQKWMVELAIQRLNDNNAWFESLKKVLDLYQIDYQDLIRAEIDLEFRKEILATLSAAQVALTNTSSLSLVDTIYQNPSLLSIAAISHHNWRLERYAFKKRNPDLKASRRIFSHHITEVLSDVMTFSTENLIEYISTKREEYEKSSDISSYESLYFLYSIACNLEQRKDVSNPQIQSIIQDLTAQIKADLNPNLLQTIIDIYQRSGKQFTEELEDI